MSHVAALPGRLRREYVLSPITALAFLVLGKQQYLLAAEDTYIKIYDVATSRLCGILPVFHAQSIHGISVPPVADHDGHDGVAGARTATPSHIIVWGGHSVKVIPSHLIEELVYAHSGSNETGVSKGSTSTAFTAPEATAPDWIFDGRISPFDNNRIILLTAHNDIIRGQITADGTTLILGKIQSPSRPILYSGNLFWVDRDCVLVAAGTVFGEIVVWKCYLDLNSEPNHINKSDGGGELREKAGSEVLFVLSGHEGSIFGVHISPEICLDSGESIRLLASCSDDRTIRIWDITERKDELTNGNKEYETQISDARQTGFGDSITGSIGPTNDSSRCVAMAMGHISRIWQVEIRAPDFLSREDRIEVYSFGEDATMQRWHLEPSISVDTISELPNTGSPNSSSQLAFKLTHHETFTHHDGKQIWSHAMTLNKTHLLIATGGGDGKIALIGGDSVYTSNHLDDSKNNIENHPHSIEEIEVSPTYLIESCKNSHLEANPSIPTFKHGNGKEMFQSFTFLTDERLLVTTRSGRLFLGGFGEELHWVELNIPEAIRLSVQSYTILRSSRRTSTAFIGAPSGELFRFHEASSESLQLIHKAERKITEIICMSDNLSSSNISQEYIEILVTVFGSTQAELLRLDENRNVMQNTEITVPDGFIVTTAARCHDYVILGSRNGSISIFDFATPNNPSPVSTMEIKRGDKITHILPLPRHSQDSPCYFLTFSRDGNYRVHEIINNADGFQIRLRHETRPPFGPMIEESWLFDRPDGKQDLMLCGFRSKYFVVWNATQQIEVATIDCGGGHRVFDQVQIRGNPGGVRFACTKASQMKIFSQTRAPHLPLKTGGHGREIKALSVSTSGRYVATGAEDTMIRLWELCGEGSNPLRCVLALEKHNTGIQKLKWSGDRYLFSSGGNEEFFVWRVTPLESDICPLGVVCEAVFSDRSEVGDLRIMDFDVRRLNDDDHGDTDTNPGAKTPRFCISMALSNSTVQSYIYSAPQGFRLLGRRRYTGACLTQLRHLHLHPEDKLQILTAATDGHLAIFTDISHPNDNTTEEDLSANLLVTKLHQSTIKALDMLTLPTTTESEPGTSYLIVTGGDDDALGVVHLYLPHYHTHNNNARYEVRSKSIIRSAHAAAVTGIGIARLENDGCDAIVVTASNDQRVRVWRIVGWQTSSKETPLKVQLLDDVYSGVADTGELEVVGQEREGERRVLVAGVGVEFWRVS